MRLGIAAESGGTAALVTTLADRAVLDCVEWIDQEHLPDYREWGGVDRGNFLDLHSAFVRARQQNLRVYGHFGGEPGAADAQMIRATLLLFAFDTSLPALVVVARDIDGKEARAIGARQAIDNPVSSPQGSDSGWPFPVVLALARPEVEAWMIVAATPVGPEETKAFRTVCDRLGFDPTRHPERLTSKRQTDPADAKRVLRELCRVGRSDQKRWEAATLNPSLPTSLRHLGTLRLV